MDFTDIFDNYSSNSYCSFSKDLQTQGLFVQTELYTDIIAPKSASSRELRLTDIDYNNYQKFDTFNQSIHLYKPLFLESSNIKTLTNEIFFYASNYTDNIRFNFSTGEIDNITNIEMKSGSNLVITNASGTELMEVDRTDGLKSYFAKYSQTYPQTFTTTSKVNILYGSASITQSSIGSPINYNTTTKTWTFNKLGYYLICITILIYNNENSDQSIELTLDKGTTPICQYENQHRANGSDQRGARLSSFQTIQNITSLSDTYSLSAQSPLSTLGFDVESVEIDIVKM